MPLYSYKCDYCGRIEEKILPVNRREEEFKCGGFTQVDMQFGNHLLDKKICAGKMIFQPVQKTTFRMTGFEKE